VVASEEDEVVVMDSTVVAEVDEVMDTVVEAVEVEAEVVEALVVLRSLKS
jgi:hypothetical protein